MQISNKPPSYLRSYALSHLPTQIWVWCEDLRPGSQSPAPSLMPGTGKRRVDPQAQGAGCIWAWHTEDAGVGLWEEE